MIHIFTTVVNRPDFLNIQYNLFEKFLKNKYIFHVIDDSSDSKITKKFEDICTDKGFKYYKTPEKTHHKNASTRVGNIIQWAFDDIIKIKYADDFVLFLDSDMFLIDYFDIEEYISDCIVSGLPQFMGNIKYMWVGIMFFNMPKLMQLDSNIKFNMDFIDGKLIDTGGQTYHFFKKNNIDMKPTDANGPEYPTHFNDIDLQKDSGGYNMELHLGGKFLHYRAATNWHSTCRSLDDPLKQKTEVFKQIIDIILSD